MVFLAKQWFFWLKGVISGVFLAKNSGFGLKGVISGLKQWFWPKKSHFWQKESFLVKTVGLAKGK